MREFTLEDIFQDRPNPLDENLFEFTGNGLLIPATHWMRELNWHIDEKLIEKVYTELWNEPFGNLGSFPEDTKEKIKNFTFSQMSKQIMEPYYKQGKLLFDNVFLVSQYDPGEEVVTSPYDPSNNNLRPRFVKGINNPDIVLLPMHLLVGFLARIMTMYDNKNRKLRMPGWKQERNLDHLKNVNHALNEMAYIRGMFESDTSFSLFVPKYFQRVITRKTMEYLPIFSGSTSMQLIIPQLESVPWDEVVDISKTNDCRLLRERIKEWDSNLQENPNVDWNEVIRNIQPILDSLINDLIKLNVSKSQAWVNFFSGLLPTPLGLIPSAIDMIKVYRNKTLAPILSKLDKSKH
ncbi:MAG: hypothetical protein PVF83_18290 [Anaerolineales bacterium]|jgi:hypothetical protein